MTGDQPTTATPGSAVVLYRTEDGRSRIQVRLEDDTVWMTQAGMAELLRPIRAGKPCSFRPRLFSPVRRRLTQCIIFGIKRERYWRLLINGVAL
jgi:hypothetical protein